MECSFGSKGIPDFWGSVDSSFSEVYLEGVVLKIQDSSEKYQCSCPCARSRSHSLK